MLIIVICSVLLVLGLVLIMVLGGKPLQAPHPEIPPAKSNDSFRKKRQSTALRSYLWWITVLSVTAIVSGILIAGAGGRIVMRILALTSPEAAGLTTEAQATVGDITVGGTFALLSFGGLFAGYISAALYLLLHRWLPAGRLGGAVFGLMILIVFGPVMDPLRAGNFDFDFIGPGWLSVLLFSVLAILHGMLIASVAGWYGSRLPAYSSRTRRAYWPLLVNVPLIGGGIVVGVGALVVMIGARILPSASAWWTARRVLWAGRVVLALSVVLSFPFFIGSLTHIMQKT